MGSDFKKKYVLLEEENHTSEGVVFCILPSLSSLDSITTLRSITRPKDGFAYSCPDLEGYCPNLVFC